MTTPNISWDISRKISKIHELIINQQGCLAATAQIDGPVTWIQLAWDSCMIFLLSLVRLVQDPPPLFYPTVFLVSIAHQSTQVDFIRGSTANSDHSRWANSEPPMVGDPMVFRSPPIPVGRSQDHVITFRDESQTNWMYTHFLSHMLDPHLNP